MLRGSIVIVLLVGVACTATGKDKDPIKTRLLASKAAYDQQMQLMRKRLDEWLNDREAAARRAGNKKVLDEVKEDRKVYQSGETGELPIHPRFRTQVSQIRARLEAAYTDAIKGYISAKKNDEAAAMEKALLELRKEFLCPILDLEKVELKEIHLPVPPDSKVELKERYFLIPPNTSVTTRRSYKGGVEIFLMAKSANIRLHAHRGSCVILNVGIDAPITPKDIRVCRPDGKADVLESGSIAAAKVPVPPSGTGFPYTIRWLLTPEGMTIYVNGKNVFEEKKDYNLDIETKLGISSGNSQIDVGEFRVTRIPPKQ